MNFNYLCEIELISEHGANAFTAIQELHFVHSEIRNVRRGVVDERANVDVDEGEQCSSCW